MARSWIKRGYGSLRPNGTVDLIRQIIVFCGAYYLYRVVRGLADGHTTIAFENARTVISIERDLGLFFEPSFHQLISTHSWIIGIASWLYLNSHFTITVVTLAYLYMFYNSSFYFVRNMFMLAMTIALLGYAFFPTAPPRLMPEWGFSDSVSTYLGVNQDDAINLLFNPYAAVPSMHVGFALMLAVPMISLARRTIVKVLWFSYPPIVFCVVVVTANHWWLDGLLGALTAAISAGGAMSFAMFQPHIWSWRGREAVLAQRRRLASINANVA